MDAAYWGKIKADEAIEKIDLERDRAVREIARVYDQIKADRVRNEISWVRIEQKGAEIKELGTDRRRLEDLKRRLQRPAYVGATVAVEEINKLHDKYFKTDDQ